MDVLQGRGLSVAAFAPLLAVIVAVAVAARHPEALAELGVSTRGAEVANDVMESPLFLTVLAAVLFWLAPLAQIAYTLDRIAAVRAQLHNLAPFALDLLPTIPATLPHWRMVLDNIERIGPFLPITLQKGCKEYTLPLLPQMMPDLEIMLASADTLAPVFPRIAPSLHRILPYAKDLLPFTDDIICVVEVDGWEALNDHLDVLVPRIARLAPHTRALVPALPQMLPYLPILMKHADALVAELDSTVGVIDRLVPLLPLLPACDQAGLLSQPLAFKALPPLLRRSPISDDTTGRAALSAASMHKRLAARAVALQAAVARKYMLYTQGSALKDSETKDGDEEEVKEDELTSAIAAAVEIAQAQPGGEHTGSETMLKT